MTRDGIADVLGQHEETLKAAKEAADVQSRQQDIKVAMQNPQIIAALLSTLHVQQMLAPMMESMAANNGMHEG